MEIKPIAFRLEVDPDLVRCDPIFIFSKDCEQILTEDGYSVLQKGPVVEVRGRFSPKCKICIYLDHGREILFCPTDSDFFRDCSIMSSQGWCNAMEIGLKYKTPNSEESHLVRYVLRIGYSAKSSDIMSYNRREKIDELHNIKRILVMAGCDSNTIDKFSLKRWIVGADDNLDKLGIGRGLSNILNEHGIQTIGELLNKTPTEITSMKGIKEKRFQTICKGLNMSLDLGTYIPRPWRIYIT